MQSYLDDALYPAQQSVLVRCEDFLFNYQKAEVGDILGMFFFLF